MKLFVLILLVVLTGCADAVKDSIDDIVNSEKKVSVPVVSSIQFSSNNTPVILQGPFISTVDVIADLGKGNCYLDKIEVTLFGAIDGAKVKSLEIVGASSVTTTLNEDEFSAVLCLAQGASALQIKAISKINTESETFKLSVNTNSGFTTIAFGHPTYPNPGFRVNSGRLSSPIESQNYVLENVSVETFRRQRLNSNTGDSNFQLETGYLSIIGQAK